MPKKPKIPHRLGILRSLTPYQKQGAFAELVGIPTPTLQSLELGRRSLTPALAKRISLATGVHPDWLLGKRDDCTLSWGEPYDTGTTLTREDIVDIEKLAARLYKAEDRVGQFVAGLLPAECVAAVANYVRELAHPVKVSADNLLAMPEIVRRLRKPEEGDHLGKHLRQGLSDSTRAQLDGDAGLALEAWSRTGTPPTTRADLERFSRAQKKLREALARDLDTILRNGLLFDRKRFGGVILSKQLQEGILGKRTDEETVRLNLKLLCAGFSDAIWMGPAMDPDILATELAQGLAGIIAGDVVHDPKIFARVSLRPLTKKLLASNPTGEFRARLNRLLLEDAFPNLISREHGRGFARWRAQLSSGSDASVAGIQPGDPLPFLPAGWGSFASSAVACRIQVLLLASAKPSTKNLQAVQQRLYSALHDIAADFGLENDIHAVLRELGAKPGDCHPLDESILDQDESWEWLFYGPAPSGEGKIKPMYAEMAKLYEERLRRRFKHYWPS